MENSCITLCSSVQDVHSFVLISFIAFLCDSLTLLRFQQLLRFAINVIEYRLNTFPLYHETCYVNNKLFYFGLIILYIIILLSFTLFFASLQVNPMGKTIYVSNDIKPSNVIMKWKDGFLVVEINLLRFYM